MTEVFDKTDIDTISEERENDECVTEYSKNYEETAEKDTNLVGCIKEEEEVEEEEGDKNGEQFEHQMDRKNSVHIIQHSLFI